VEQPDGTGPDLALLLRRWRQRRLLTQEDVARRSGLSVGTIAGLERGRTQRPRGATLRLLSDALGLGADERSALAAAAEALEGGEAVAARAPAPERASALPSVPTASPPAHAAGRGDADPSSVDVPVAQLPPALSGFTGRRADLRRLDDLLSVGVAPASPVPIVAVTGVAGVGKTSLAVHWAHRVAERFPHGQLYADLRGYGPGPAEPVSRVVGDFLAALGVPRPGQPLTVDGQVALYRSLLAGRRILVVLDNARDADHVRPLLPGSSSCAVLITSRDNLAALVATHGARPVDLDVLDAEEARQLLAHRLGPDRLAAEPESVQQIVARCAGLPLALAVVGAQAVTRPKARLEALVDELNRTGAGLAPFTAGDTATDMRTVFSWSYLATSEAARELFGLLGLLPGPSLRSSTAASLAGLPVDDVHRLLSELVRGSLLRQAAPDRFMLHDLLAAYAAELAPARDEVRRPAVSRLLDHYSRTAHAAGRRFAPDRPEHPLPAGDPHVTPEPLETADQAVTWFTDERERITALLDRCTELDIADGGDRAWCLATCLTDLYDRNGLWLDWIPLLTVALAAVRLQGDARQEAEVHRLLARPNLQLRRLDVARDHLLCAVDIFEHCDDPAGQGRSHRNLAYLHQLEGRPDAGLHSARRALELFRSVGDRTSEVLALSTVAWFEVLTGDHVGALRHGAEALALYEASEDVAGQASVWDTYGHAHHRRGDLARAVHSYERAVALYRQAADRFNQADSLTSLGDARLAAGNAQGATDAWREALAILDALGHDQADGVRARLDPPGTTPAGAP
jgi:transcriptional regulator with XRE-family HTH domain/tetratricopeptide (TPR) repeat protein